MIWEVRTFVGEPTGRATDKYAGYRKGQQYALRYTHQVDGTVCIEGVASLGIRRLVVSASLFERWWHTVH